MAELPAIKKKTKHFKQDEFMDSLFKAYQRQFGDDEFKTKTRFGPSSIGYGSGTCPRRWFYAFKGAVFVESGLDISSFANRMNGTDAHTRIQKVIAESDIDADFEVTVSLDDPPIFGYIDVLLNYDGVKVPMEIKTTRTEAFDYNKMMAQTSAYHLLQVLIYMYILGVDEGVVLYENKNTLEIHTVPVLMNKRNEEYVEEVFAWMRKVRSAYDNDQLPARPFRRNNKICKQCPFYVMCYDDKTPAGIDILPLEVKKYA